MVQDKSSPFHTSFASPSNVPRWVRSSLFSPPWARTNLAPPPSPSFSSPSTLRGRCCSAATRVTTAETRDAVASLSPSPRDRRVRYAELLLRALARRRSNGGTHRGSEIADGRDGSGTKKRTGQWKEEGYTPRCETLVYRLLTPRSTHNRAQTLPLLAYVRPHRPLIVLRFL